MDTVFFKGDFDGFFCTLFNASSAASQKLLCRRTLGSNPGLLRLWLWQPDALTTRLDLIHLLQLLLCGYFLYKSYIDNNVYVFEVKSTDFLHLFKGSEVSLKFWVFWNPYCHTAFFAWLKILSQTCAKWNETARNENANQSELQFPLLGLEHHVESIPGILRSLQIFFHLPICPVFHFPTSVIVSPTKLLAIVFFGGSVQSYICLV